jgi:hypothetical protein
LIKDSEPKYRGKELWNKKRLPFSELLQMGGKTSALLHGTSWEGSGGSNYLIPGRQQLPFLQGVDNKFPWHVALGENVCSVHVGMAQITKEVTDWAPFPFL